ncbi:MAG: hypothetical protein HQL54_01760 [Magnetococcales bacterium]|nr:hypothetical protein [Magnetococcales bacterium]
MVEAKSTAKALAIHNAVESHSIFLESIGKVENGLLREDIIHAISGGLVHDIRITEENILENTIFIRVEGNIDPTEMHQTITDLINKKSLAPEDISSNKKDDLVVYLLSGGVLLAIIMLIYTNNKNISARKRIIKNSSVTSQPVIESRSQNVTKNYSSKDFTKYLFNKKIYGKGRLVLAVISQYVKENPNISHDSLKGIFSDSIQASTNMQFSGKEDQVVFKRLEKIHRASYKYYFMKDYELISLCDCKIAVSREWNRENIQVFIEVAKKNGYGAKVAI